MYIMVWLQLKPHRFVNNLKDRVNICTFHEAPLRMPYQKLLLGFVARCCLLLKYRHAIYRSQVMPLSEKYMVIIYLALYVVNNYVLRRSEYLTKLIRIEKCFQFKALQKIALLITQSMHCFPVPHVAIVKFLIFLLLLNW